MMVGTEENSSVVLALGCKAAARAVGLSERSFRRGISAGRIPQGLKIGGRRVWPVEGPNGLKAWLAAGCPPRHEWHADRTEGER